MRTTAALLMLLLAACETTQGSSSGRSSLSYGRNAQEAYEVALLEFRNDDCLEAEPMFRRIRREYPYSRFAALAELRVADCKFKQSQWAEAITAYRQFVRFRPSHDQISYARFRVAQAHFEQIPSEWFLSPPTHERDQGPTNDALRQLRRFILDFPEDDRVEEAQDMVRRCLKLLAEHELYAARFYLRRDAYPAVILRLQTLLSSYQGSGVEPEALMLLGETYLETGDRPQARQAFEEIVERFPESDQAGDARDQLASL
ncbi:MAG TPA: outer membrane protein assembly factor BamD [Polyangiaceae bacterium LLY-WYZ-15_(1-7)]|nr:outer membrane protein assembly factor BamD [Polyangiaceae bacterium LLY-WYZ-15_(1-7)]HJL03638.1 outer membrane protein assembly factor BamD [Polyangiaceae bacterium LLY-WYZ-15_(1-7)]HJL12717.1 outer membrane protein assembly factor BamD [Polyangiaceae bacterium LLY-WYZ-15_(1-7)]HJL27489.1 outer membrane protein assembly factor BamD [Polyangiaceae bacterium LLY-WYZ-15_(1-7)]HJL35969.1 outer membrane protein assembly factor BamD [Polyangiaceae bacterium LLY-WYZ-15_(1-7)]